MSRPGLPAAAIAPPPSPRGGQRIALVAEAEFGYTALARQADAGGADPMGYGVIGSPTGSGPVSLGSSPGTPATHRSATAIGWQSRFIVFVTCGYAER